MNPALGIAAGNRMSLYQIALGAGDLRACHAEEVEKFPDAEGFHRIISLEEVFGTIESNMDCFSVIISVEFAFGQTQVPLLMKDDTRAFLGSRDAYMIL